MIRRVIKIGNSYYISLPKKWVENILRSEKAVELILEENGELRIVPYSRKSESQGIHRRILYDEKVFRKILAGYLNGDDIIEVVAKNQLPRKFFEELNKFIRNLIGLEVVEEDATRVVLQCFVSNEIDLEQIIHRMDNVTRSMYLDGARALVEGNKDIASNIIKRDDNVDRLYFLAVRGIRKSIKDPLKPGEQKLKHLDFRLVVRSLEQIGDYAEKIAVYVLKGFRESSSIIEKAKQLARHQEKIVKAILCDQPCTELSGGIEIAFPDTPPGETFKLIESEINDLVDLVS